MSKKYEKAKKEILEILKKNGYDKDITTTQFLLAKIVGLVWKNLSKGEQDGESTSIKE